MALRTVEVRTVVDLDLLRLEPFPTPHESQAVDALDPQGFRDLVDHLPALLPRVLAIHRLRAVLLPLAHARVGPHDGAHPPTQVPPFPRVPTEHGHAQIKRLPRRHGEHELHDLDLGLRPVRRRRARELGMRLRVVQRGWGVEVTGEVWVLPCPLELQKQWQTSGGGRDRALGWAAPVEPAAWSGSPRRSSPSPRDVQIAS